MECRILKENLSSLIIFCSGSIQFRVDFCPQDGAWLGHGSYSVTPHVIFWAWGKGLLPGQGSVVEGPIIMFLFVFLLVSNVSLIAHSVINIVAISV